MLLMVLGPVLGVLTVVFLPLIGFVMPTGFTGAKLVAVGRRVIGALVSESRA